MPEAKATGHLRFTENHCLRPWEPQGWRRGFCPPDSGLGWPSLGSPGEESGAGGVGPAGRCSAPSPVRARKLRGGFLPASPLPRPTSFTPVISPPGACRLPAAC